MTLSLPLWAVAALSGAVLQTARNAAQARLTDAIGTLGATQVRFLFGLPFALLFLALFAAGRGEAVPRLTAAALAWNAMGAWAQIGGTALMLVLMKSRGFGVSTAWLKTEPVLVALLGVAVLGDPLSPGMMLAIALSVVGVLILSVRGGTIGHYLDGRPAVLGLVGGLGFGLAAIGFRGSITALPTGSFLMRALVSLALSLAIQTVTLVIYLALFDRAALTASFRVWRTSLLAGLAGALASACWFAGFALTSAANVRTLALIEVPIALLTGRVLFGQKPTPRHMLGMAVILAGVLALLHLQA